LVKKEKKNPPGNMDVFKIFISSFYVYAIHGVTQLAQLTTW